MEAERRAAGGGAPPAAEKDAAEAEAALGALRADAAGR
jgi:hypothetical protein